MNRRQLFTALAAAGISAPALAATPARFTSAVTGEGPDVILIPGLASSKEVWDQTARDLSVGHRVHVLQVAGFAGLPAGPNAEGPILQPLVDAVAAYIAAKALVRPAVIGHSMGGLVGLLLAAQRPAAVGKLMVVDALPFYPLIFNPAATVASVQVTATGMREQILAMSPETFVMSQSLSVSRLTRSQTAVATVLRWSLESDRSVVARGLYDVLTTDVRPTLAAIAAPVTVVYAHDVVMGFPAASVDALYAGAYTDVKGVKLKRIDGGLHFIMLDQPEAFALQVKDFLS